MAETATDSSVSGVESATEMARRTTSFVVSMLKWLVLLNAAAAWVVVWGNLVRLHLVLGQLPNAVLTAALFFGPGVVAAGWWVDRKLGLRESVSGSSGATGSPS